MTTALISAFVYGLSAGVLPGPLMTFVITQALKHGAREGVRASFAPLLSDGPIMLVLLLFLDTITRYKALVGVIALGGAVYLLFMAWESWTSRPPDASAAAVTQPRSLARGALVNLLNPNPYLFWLMVGVPSMAKAWVVTPAAAIAFAVVFFVLLIGCKVTTAILVGRSREWLAGSWYVGIMRGLAVVLLVFAGVMVRDAFALLG